MKSVQKGVHDFLFKLTHEGADSVLVFMMDGLDAWLQLSPGILIARFEELGAPGVVIGADKTCWPWRDVSTLMFFHCGN
jgi:hypothetical protein